MKSSSICQRSDSYSRWYSDVIAQADLAEHSAVRGCMVIKPNGYAIWEKMARILDDMLKSLGVKNAYFPLLIPKSFLDKEKEHIEGFSPELAIVTHGGGKKLVEPLVIRPTSETIINDSFAKWIESYRDLPMIINQWANVVRWEMRPRLFLRTTEFLWQEGHSAHVSLEEAEQYALLILNGVYKRFAEEYLAIPVYTGQKSEGEKFAGALRTFCIESLMQDGKSLQMGTSHNLSDNFSKSFKITYLDQGGKNRLVYQTSWGVSTRLVGGLIMAHSDDKGLVLPPKVAPTHVVIVPIMPEDNKILREIERLKENLKGVSLEVDLRPHVRTGEKFYEWEKKGVPVRIEIGPRDLEKKSAVLVRRDTGEKENCPLDLIDQRVHVLLDEIQQNLLSIAQERLKERQTSIDSWDEFASMVKQGGYVFAHWCGEKTCEAKIKEKAGVVSRFLPFDGKEEDGDHSCIHCNKKVTTNKRWAFAGAY